MSIQSISWHLTLTSSTNFLIEHITHLLPIIIIISITKILIRHTLLIYVPTPVGSFSAITSSSSSVLQSLLSSLLEVIRVYVHTQTSMLSGHRLKRWKLMWSVDFQVAPDTEDHINKTFELDDFGI